MTNLLYNDNKLEQKEVCTMITVDTFVQNKLRTLRQTNGFTLEQLAERLETTPITLSRYETGKRSGSLVVLEEICRIYNLTVTDFFADKNADNNISLLETRAASVADSQDNLVPIYGNIAAGSFTSAVEDHIDEIEIPQTFLNRFGKDNLFGLAVHGESMNKVVQNNDYVILNRQQQADNGDIVAVLLNNEEATLKRFYQLDAETIILKPESNDASFQPITVDLRQPDTNLSILGKAIWYCAPYSLNL